MEHERNYGLDLLRMVSMLMVAVLHVLGQGGVMSRTGTNIASYNTCYFLEAACLCATNCYGLLSGYVGVRSSFNARKLIRMILTVEFYSIVIGLLLGLPNRAWLDRDMLLKILLPIQWRTWWYYSAYIGLYFLMPFLNRGVKALSGKEKDNLLSVSFMIFCVFPLVAKTFSSDFFALVGGYSLIWLIILYVCGACLRLLDEERTAADTGAAEAVNRSGQTESAGQGQNENTQQNEYAQLKNAREQHTRPAAEKKGPGSSGLWTQVLRLRIPALLLIFLVSTTFAWLWKLLVDMGVIKAPADTTFPRMFLYYHAPTMVINALAILLAFRKFRIRPGRLRRIITLLAPSAFYVYIIHTHPLIWEYYLKTAFVSWREMPPALILLPVLGVALGIYLACSVIDLGRRKSGSLISVLRNKGKDRNRQKTEGRQE